ncbi:MAG: zinc ribbon domain-containing protein [Vallitaleaceae bacterium]|jgi:hypothetical protein|nr:zinc ribbon domain-containing protein [Vallitaleaceae bacterium]
MYCGNCGTELDKGTMFCQMCGTPLEKGSKVNQTNQGSSGSYVQNANMGSTPHQGVGTYQGAISTQPEKKGGCLKGCLIAFGGIFGVGVIAIIIYLVVGSFITGNSNQRDYYDKGDMPVIETDDELTVGNTMIIIRQLSEMYIEATELTEEIYSTDPLTTSYEDWKDDLDEAMDLWEQIEDYSATFSDLLDEADYKTGLDLDLHFGSTAYAYTKEEVTAFYDNAPKGTGKMRIELLAENLGVSAEKAFAILKMSNDQLEAEAWNDAGDTFEKLEQGATAIKAVSDVAVAVGAAVATGGTVGTVSLVGKGVAIIKNADLVLGVAGDMAFVVMGEDAENNAIVANINAIKDYTGVVASVDDLICIDTDSISDVAIYTVKGLNDYLQNDQILGIDLSDIDQKDESLKVSLLGDDEIGDYIDDNNIDVYLGTDTADQVGNDTENNGGDNSATIDSGQVTSDNQDDDLSYDEVISWVKGNWIKVGNYDTFEDAIVADTNDLFVWTVFFSSTSVTVMETEMIDFEYYPVYFTGDFEVEVSDYGDVSFTGTTPGHETVTDNGELPFWFTLYEIDGEMYIIDQYSGDAYLKEQ